MIIDILLAALSITSAAVISSPKIRVRRGLERFSLPDNATSIRENIATSFNCQARNYGYYADTENDCQLFHVCLPVVWDGDGAQQTFMWSFICPQETVFNQGRMMVLFWDERSPQNVSEKFTCARPEDSIPCQESSMFYTLNDRFGEKMPSNEVTEPMDIPSTSNFIEER